MRSRPATGHIHLSFLPKLIEEVIASRIFSHIEDNAIIDKFQSAYKCGHNTETASLLVVLLDLPAACDTIDHGSLFSILEKYVGIVGITGSALLF